MRENMGAACSGCFGGSAPVYAHPYICVFGLPGAGKGTQVERLVADHKEVLHISTGALLRNYLASDARNEATALTIEHCMSIGELVADDVMLEVVQHAVQEAPDDAVVLLDGFPRDKHQAEDCCVLLGGPPILSVLFEISEDEMARRVMSRDEGRADDNAEALRHRLDSFRNETEPAVEFLEANGGVNRIDGERDVEDVYSDFARLYGEASDALASQLGQLAPEEKIRVINPLQDTDDEDDEDDAADNEAEETQESPWAHGTRFADAQDNIKNLEAVLEDFEGPDRIALESRIATLKASLASFDEE